MNYILILLALVLLFILYNNYFTNIENLENNTDKENNDDNNNNDNSNDNSCLSKDPLFLSINNASKINILSKEVNKLQGLKKEVNGMKNRLSMLEKSVTEMTNNIGNAGFASAGRDMKTIKDPPPKISGLN
jgi:hypothetical protein